MMDIDFSDLRRAIRDISEDLEQQATEAMRAATALAKRELREQVTRAGLGQRLANTWQDKVYPIKRSSLNATGYVYSRAPAIIEPYATGAVIRPRDGRQYLFIPTKNVPLAKRRRGPRLPMSWEEVEAEFNQDLIIRRLRSGNLGAFVAVSLQKKRGVGLRKVRKGRRAHGADRELVLMFTLIRSTARPKKLDLEGVAERATGNFSRLFGEGS